MTQTCCRKDAYGRTVGTRHDTETGKAVAPGEESPYFTRHGGTVTRQTAGSFGGRPFCCSPCAMQVPNLPALQRGGARHVRHVHVPTFCDGERSGFRCARQGAESRGGAWPDCFRKRRRRRQSGPMPLFPIPGTPWNATGKAAQKKDFWQRTKGCRHEGSSRVPIPYPRRVRLQGCRRLFRPRPRRRPIGAPESWPARPKGGSTRRQNPANRACWPWIPNQGK